MLHHPVPVRPLDAMSLSQAYMPMYPHHATPTPSRARTRQVIDKIKRHASAFVKSPSRRIRAQSCADRSLEHTTVHQVPTVTFASPPPLDSDFTTTTRVRSTSLSNDDEVLSTTATLLHFDAPAACDFAPYLPLASSRFDRDATDALVYTPPPLSLADAAALRHSVIPPPSPSPSDHSDSTSSSTRSPVTPVFSTYDVHPYASAAAISQRWSVGSDEQGQNNDPFTKGKVQIVRRSLIQDSFLMACAAADDSQGGQQSAASGEDNAGHVSLGRSPKGKRQSVFKKKSNVSLPPSKPPPSCPLPSPPPTASSESSVSIYSSGVVERERSRTPSPVADEEWTLFLGAPSKPLDLPDVKDDKRNNNNRSASTSSPVPSPPSKQHLSPTDIPPQAQRARTISNRSTNSTTATGRRIESGPAPNSRSRIDDDDDEGHDVFEDWTLSLPVLKKPKSSLALVDGIEPVEEEQQHRARKCKSFIDWTTSLSDPYEREQNRLRERERKSSHVSMAAAASQRSTTGVKRLLPIGPTTTTITTPTPTPPHNTSSTTSLNLNRSLTKSTTSLRSLASSISTSSSSTSSYKDILPFDPCSPDIAPVSPFAPSFSNQSTYADSLLIIPPPRPLSIATSTISDVTSTTTTNSAVERFANKFPLPPSFSAKLMQRRSGVVLPRPLRTTIGGGGGGYQGIGNGSAGSGGRRSFTLNSSSSSPACSSPLSAGRRSFTLNSASSSPRKKRGSLAGVYFEPSRASTSTALPSTDTSIISSSTHLSATDLDAHVASAPATSLHFPSSAYNLLLPRRSSSLRRQFSPSSTHGHLPQLAAAEKDAVVNGRPESWYLMKQNCGGGAGDRGERPTTSSSVESSSSDVSTTSTSSTASTASTVTAGSVRSGRSRRSVRSHSSSSTVVPHHHHRSRLSTTNTFGLSPNEEEGRRSGSMEFIPRGSMDGSTIRSSLDTSTTTSTTGGGYETCNDDGYSEFDYRARVMSCSPTSHTSRRRFVVSPTAARTSRSSSRSNLVLEDEFLVFEEDEDEEEEGEGGEEWYEECFYSARSSLNF